MVEVRILSVVLLRCRLGRPWFPSPGSSVRFTGDVLLLTTCSPVARALGSDPRDRWCKSSHVDDISGCSSGVERVVRDDEAAGAIPVTQTQRPALSSRAEPSADNREMEVQILQGGLMVVESEAVEERGREPR